MIVRSSNRPSARSSAQAATYHALRRYLPLTIFFLLSMRSVSGSLVIGFSPSLPIILRPLPTGQAAADRGPLGPRNGAPHRACAMGTPRGDERSINLRSPLEPGHHRLRKQAGGRENL